MILDSSFYLFAVPAVLLVGISKGGDGGSFGMIGVLLMTLIVSPTETAGILLPILIAMDLVSVWIYRRSWDRQNFSLLATGAIIGIFVGSITARAIDDDIIRILIGGLSLGFLLNQYIQKNIQRKSSFTLSGKDKYSNKLSNQISGLGWGAVGGFASFLTHAGGPAFQFHMLPQQLSPRLYVGTSAVFFAFTNVVKIVPYFWLGMLNQGNFHISAGLLPLAPIGVFVGFKLLTYIPKQAFYRFADGMLMVVGIKLLIDVITG